MPRAGAKGERLWAVLALGAGLPGCGQLLGVDEFGTGCSSEQISEGGGCTDVPSCGPDERPVAGGACATVGASAIECGEGLVADPERPGGCRELLPDPDGCEEAHLVALGTIDCALGFACNSPIDIMVGTILEVDPGAGEAGAANTFTTIQAALDAAVEIEGEVSVQVAPGEYRETLRLTRKIFLRGRCPQECSIVGVDADRPVITLEADADGAVIDKLSVRGGAAGVVAEGVSDLSLSFLRVGPVSGPGVVLSDAGGSASALVTGVVIDRATGVGLDAWGVSELTVAATRIASTRAGADGLGIGIRLGPSPLAPLDQLEGAPPYARTTFGVRTEATLDTTRIEGAIGVGLLVRGARAVVRSLSVRHVTADPDAVAVGVLAEPLLQGMVPAELTLEHAVVSHVEGAGIRLDDVARATLEDVTVHDVGLAPAAESALASCAGSGIRIRRRLASLEHPDAVVLRRVLVDGARESGVHVEGEAVNLEDTLIRGVAGCDGDSADGIAVYDYPDSPATVAIVRTRVDSTSGQPALALWSGDARLEESALGGCATAAGLRRVAGGETSLCRCGADWERCQPRELVAPPRLIGFPECDPATEMCIAWCVVDLLGAPGAASVPGVVMDALHPGLATARADDRACLSVPMPQGVPWYGRVLAPARSPVLGTGVAHRLGRASPGRNGIVGESAVNLQPILVSGRESEVSDLRRALFVPVQACNPPPALPLPEDELCFGGKGVEGIRFEILDEAEQVIDTAWAEPRYFGEDTALPDGSLHATSTNGTGFFWNVPAGTYLVRLHPPDGKTLSCELDPWDTGFDQGVAGPGANTYRARAGSGLNSYAAKTYCTLGPPGE